MTEYKSDIDVYIYLFIYFLTGAKTRDNMTIECVCVLDSTQLGSYNAMIVQLYEKGKYIQSKFKKRKG